MRSVEDRGRRRLAVVPPRYGPDVLGGAEVVLAELGRGLAERGWDVEVLTTCARDHFTWENAYPPGTTQEGGLTVRRFPAVVSTARAERAQLEARILAGDRLSLHEQQRWVNDDLRAPALFHHLLAEATGYRALVFAPYLFWTTFACGQVAPERTVLMPCLHDEPQAALELFRPLFAGAAGAWFLSEPEQALAAELGLMPRRHRVIGSGITAPASYDPEGFRKRHGIEGRFVYYGGRREGGKGWERLLDGFARAVGRADLPFSLVTTGTGPVTPPGELSGRVIDLGFVDDAERNDAMAAADAYLQPSRHESFSRPLLEAWLAGTPVIGNAASEVVRWHCERSGAGLLYDDDAELEQCLRFVAEAPAAAATLAAGGRSYVLDSYRWPDVLDRVEEDLTSWF
ncbi:glycosyltransferase family 4 protein [soil metagenome]